MPVGPRPRSIGFLPDGSRAYVSLENDGAIAVIDGKQHKFLRLIQLEGKGNTPKPRPMGIAVHPDGSMVYVTSRLVRQPVHGRSGEERVDRIDSKSASVRGASALLPDGKTIYTANGPSNDVSVVDLATKTGGEEDRRRRSAVGHRGRGR